MTKKGLALTLALVMAWAVAVPAFGQANPFRDVPLDHWAYDAVATLAAAGLVEGYPDGTFGGERTFTRYEMAMVFARILARFEALIEAGIASTVDAKLAELWAAVNELAADMEAAHSHFIAGQHVHPDGTVHTTIQLSPEMEAAVRAVAADQIRQELGGMEPGAIAGLANPEALKAYVDERADEIATAVVALSMDFGSELELLGVRVSELERLFTTVNTRLAAVEQQVQQAHSAAETARGIADAAQAAADAAADAAAEALAKAEAAWTLVQQLQAQGASEAELIEATALAGSAQEAADSAQDRAYRARLAAERAAASAATALEAADRASKIAEMAHSDAGTALALAQEAHDLAAKAMAEAAAQGDQARAEALRAMERAQRADQQAYRARLTAERALTRLEALQDEVAALQDQVAELSSRPVLGGEIRAEYELTQTSTGNSVPSDPRDKDSSSISPANFFRTAVGLKATFKPSEDVTVEGGIRLRAPLFGSTTSTINLTDLHVKVTTNGALRMAYFGSVTGAELAQGFNKYTFNADTYNAKVASANRGGAIVETQIGNVSSRFIASRFPTPGVTPDDGRNLYGVTTTIPLADGLNLQANYLWWTAEDRSASVQAYGETGGLKYDWIYALYKEHPAIDGKISTTIGSVDVAFTYRSVDGAYAPADPNDPRPTLPHLGKWLRTQDGDLLPDQRKYVVEASAPVWGLTALAEKGHHDKKLDGSQFTDWMMFGFKDLDLLGFKLGARAYNDTRDADRQTQALRVDLSRDFKLGLPFTFTVTHVNATLSNWTSPSWTNRSHLGIGVAVKDYALTEALTFSGSIKTEQNPIKDDEWTEPGNWNPEVASSKNDGASANVFNQDTASASLKFAATDNLALNAGFTLERVDTSGDGVRDASIRTTEFGADYTLDLGVADVTLGYGYQLRSVDGLTYASSPKTTWSIGIKRQLLGATVDATYKVVTGRGTDGKVKLNAVDTTASLSIKYPIADSFDFTLSGKWGQSSGNEAGDPDYKDYSYSSIQAGLGFTF